MSTGFKDHFSGHAADYRAYRPAYPPDLFAFLAAAAPGRELAWDCGTGSGQAAVALADHFAKVFATDPSAEQVRMAEPHPRVEYAVAPAERCPLPGHAADLVTVAQALHWFHLDRFYAEVRRVCRPNGVLAVWTYNLHSVNPPVDAALHRFRTDFVDPYWPPERAWVDAGYRNVPFPFAEVSAPRFEMKADWELPRMLGYLRTWSATKAFQKAMGFDPVGRLANEFEAAWGGRGERTVTWELVLRVGRVPV